MEGGLLLAYAAVAIGMRPGTVERLPFLWGIHCIYDIFPRRSPPRALDDASLFEMFCADYQENVREVFASIRASCATETMEDADLEQRALDIGEQLLVEETETNERNKARTLKRRRRSDAVATSTRNASSRHFGACARTPTQRTARSCTTRRTTRQTKPATANEAVDETDNEAVAATASEVATAAGIAQCPQK